MKRAQISALAEADLTEIWWFIAQDDTQEADRYVSLLRQKCQALAESPGIGRERIEIVDGLRGFPVGNYIIFYRETDFGIEVTRVISGFRDIPRALGER